MLSILSASPAWDAVVCVLLAAVAYVAVLRAVDLVGIARFHGRFVALMRDEQEPRVAQACTLLDSYQTWADERAAAGRTGLDAFYMQLFEAELALCRFVVYSYMPLWKTQAEVLRVFCNFCALVDVAPVADETWRGTLGRGVERLVARNPLRRSTYAFYCGLACRQNAPPTLMTLSADAAAACNANAAISAAGSLPSDLNV